MKRNALAMFGVSVALVLSAGTVQAAGRGVDNPVATHKGSAAEEGGVVGGGYVYTGRPNDNRYVERARAEGDAEFAVMDVHGESAGSINAAHNGRPMDNRHLMQ